MDVLPFYCSRCKTEFKSACQCGSFKLRTENKIIHCADAYQQDEGGVIEKASAAIHLNPHDHKKEKDWKVILDFVTREFKGRSCNNVLELGGGSGNIAYHFSARGAVSVVEDLNLTYLQDAVDRHKNIHGLLHDINQPLPFADNSFDLVCCIGTLHYGYIRNVESVLKEIHRTSKKYIFIDVLSRHSPYRYLEQIYNPSYNPRRYSTKETARLIATMPAKTKAVTSSKTIGPLRETFPFTGKTVYLLLEKA